MQIPWYIGWPIVIAFVVGILFMVASRAPYYPLKYPSGFWELQSKLGAEDVWLSGLEQAATIFQRYDVVAVAVEEQQRRADVGDLTFRVGCTFRTG